MYETESMTYVCLDSINNRRACGHVDVGTCPLQGLAATLTLFQPEGSDYAHQVLKATGAPESSLLNERT